MNDDFCTEHGYEFMTTQFGNPIPYCSECDRQRQTALEKDDLLCTCPKPKYTWGPWFSRRSGEKQQVIATLPTLRDAERCPVHRRKDAEIGSDNPRKKRGE